MSLVEIDKGVFLEAMIKRFNRAELRRVCFELGIPDENLGKGTLETFAMELVEYAHRRDMNGELTHAIVTRRPEMLKRVNFKTGPMLLAAPPSMPDAAYKQGYDQVIGYVGKGLFSLQRLMLAQSVFLGLLVLAMLLIVALR